jgi:hypothetical protein
MRKWLLSNCMVFFTSIIFGQAFNPGDKVEVFNSGGWYAASIVKPGTNDFQGYYYVQYEKYTQGQWIAAKNIRRAGNAMVNTAAGPRNGTYIILSYGNPANPIRLGYFDLGNGTYIYYNLAKKAIGKGKYSYDKDHKTLRWLSGPFKDANWGGSFEIDREGKTHKIRLNAATIGSNSTDSN